MTCPNAVSEKETLGPTTALPSVPDETSPMDPLDPGVVEQEKARRQAAARKAEEQARAALAPPEPSDMARTVLETPAVRADADDFMRAKAAKKAAAAPEPKSQAQAKTKAEPEAKTRRAGKVKNPPPSRAADDVKTVLEMQAVPAPDPGLKRGKRKPPPRAPGKKKLSDGQLDNIANSTKAEVSKAKKASRSGRTKMEVSRVTPPDDDKTKQADAVPASGPPAGVEVAAGPKTLKPFKKGAKDGPKSASRSKEFSETQWFMKGIEVDADLLETVDTEEYDRDENIGEKERRKFTLRRESEE